MINVRFSKINILIEKELLNDMLFLEQKEGLNESGGILLGKHNKKKHLYQITFFSKPNKKDNCGKYYFIRNKEAAQQVIDNKWKESLGIVNYLGEWHTHPCTNPYPSNTDLSLLKSIIEDKSNVWPNVIMIIIGQNKTYSIINCYKTKSKIKFELRKGIC